MQTKNGHKIQPKKMFTECEQKCSLNANKMFTKCKQNIHKCKQKPYSQNANEILYHEMRAKQITHQVRTKVLAICEQNN